MWLRRLLHELGCSQHESTPIYCDNGITIKLSKNPVMHGRSKHIDIRFHFLCELTGKEEVNLIHYWTQEQIADILTKLLQLDGFRRMHNLLGVRSSSYVN